MLIAMSWGGIRFPWSSGHVLVPLVVGGIGMVAFFVYERVWSGHTVGGFSIPLPAWEYRSADMWGIGPELPVHKPHSAKWVSALRPLQYIVAEALIYRCV